MFTPDQDGINHINVYTKSQTEIGKMLSNLSNYGFVHPEFGSFKTLEGFWFWLVTDKKHHKLKELDGFNANKEGRKICDDSSIDYDSITSSNQFRDTFKSGIECKLRQNTFILQKLVETKELPLTHYFFYSPRDGDLSRAKTIDKPQHQWQMDILEDIRNKTIIWMKIKNIQDISHIQLQG